MTEPRHAPFGESSGLLEELLDSVPDAMILVDRHGRILFANSHMEALFGYHRDELRGAPVDLLVPTRYRDDHPGFRADFFTKPKSRPMGAELDLYGLRKDGREFPVEISLSPRETKAGVFVFAAVRDATIRKRAEEALRTSFDRERLVAEDLRAVDEIKNAFLKAVSHDLRTPLAAIRGFAETLELHRQKLSQEQVTHALQRIITSADKLDRILSELLDLDRMSRGVLQLNRTRIDVRATFERVVEEFDLGEHPVEVVAESVFADVDETQVERIVENLLANAVRYTPPASPIWIHAERASHGVQISVEDAGPGVPDQLKRAVFEAFRRGEGVEGVSGTGIGLSLVSQFAKMHGGRAWVEDRPAGGASFRVFLPDDPANDFDVRRGDAGSHRAGSEPGTVSG